MNMPSIAWPSHASRPTSEEPRASTRPRRSRDPWLGTCAADLTEP
jgi:hypothetical protein